MTNNPRTDNFTHLQFLTISWSKVVIHNCTWRSNESQQQQHFVCVHLSFSGFSYWITLTLWCVPVYTFLPTKQTRGDTTGGLSITANTWCWCVEALIKDVVELHCRKCRMHCFGGLTFPMNGKLKFFSLCYIDSCYCLSLCCSLVLYHFSTPADAKPLRKWSPMCASMSNCGQLFRQISRSIHHVSGYTSLK